MQALQSKFGAMLVVGGDGSGPAQPEPRLMLAAFNQQTAGVCRTDASNQAWLEAWHERKGLELTRLASPRAVARLLVRASAAGGLRRGAAA